VGPTRRRGGTRPSVNKEEQEIEQAALIGSATTRILDARSVAALKAAAGKGQELRLPEGIDVERLSRAADMERILFRDVHLSQVPEPTSDEQNGAPLRCPSSTELEAAAHAMAASISFRRLATALKHGLMDPEIAAEAMAHVRAAARLFKFSVDAPPGARRAVVMSLMEFQCEGIYELMREGTEQVRANLVRSVALGVISGICVRVPDLADVAQKPESLRAALAVARAWTNARQGGPGIDTALQNLFNLLGLPLGWRSVRQARMDWRRTRRDGKPRARKGGSRG
jgi:hypothetical protein